MIFIAFGTFLAPNAPIFILSEHLTTELVRARMSLTSSIINACFENLCETLVRKFSIGTTLKSL